MSKNSIDDFDFGFSAVSEDELAAREREAEDRARKEAEKILNKQQSEASSIIDELTGTAEEYKQRMEMIYNMIIPLLNNLEKDSESKSYIYWPDRKKKIQEFKVRIQAVVNGG